MGTGEGGDAVQRAHRDAGDEVWPTPQVRDYASWVREQHLQQQLADANAPRNRKEPLRILTSKMERSWYAGRGASAEDFQDSLRQLEALGCPLQ